MLSSQGANLKGAAISIGVGLAIRYLIPVPAGLTPQVHTVEDHLHYYKTAITVACILYRDPMLTFLCFSTGLVPDVYLCGNHCWAGG